jgi:hypothetical protein
MAYCIENNEMALLSQLRNSQYVFNITALTVHKSNHKAILVIGRIHSIGLLQYLIFYPSPPSQWTSYRRYKNYVQRSIK